MATQSLTPMADSSTGGTSKGFSFGTAFSDLLGAGVDFGKWKLQTEAYKDVLGTQVQLKTMQDNLAKSQAASTAAQSGTTSASAATAASKPPFNWQPWALALGGVVVLAITYKMVK